MKRYRERWRNILRDALEKISPEAAGEDIVIETPPQPELGDIAFPMFPYARKAKRPPQEIARSVAEEIRAAGAEERGAGTVETGGPYVNVRLIRPFVIQEILDDVEEQGDRYGASGERDTERIMVEFSCPNTNKPLHLGHLRNDAIGESLSRILAAAGAEVRKVNLINDRGVHICQSMLAYQMFGGNGTPESEEVKGDHFVGGYYVRFHQWAKEHPEAGERVREMLRAWEEGREEVLELWERMNRWVIDGIEETYQRTGVSFDAVYRESEVYRFGRDEVLRGLQKGLFVRESDGSVWVDLSEEGLDREVLLRSDGTSLYLTQDIGTAVQRFGDWPFDRLIYVVASEQKRHFQVLFRVLGLLGYPWATSLHHLAYGMVHLPEGKMKSREGTVVDADELLDELNGLAEDEIREKGREAEIRDTGETAERIALGALNYYLLQVSPYKDMVFDPQESISFTGNTGPYLQYTGARISSMLRKFEERKSRYGAGRFQPELLSLPEEWEIVKLVAAYPDTVSLAARELNPSLATLYLFELAKAFSRYYQDNPVLRNENPDLVVTRIRFVKAVKQVLKSGFKLIAIPFLEVM